MNSRMYRGAFLRGVLCCFACAGSARAAEVFLVAASGSTTIGPGQTVTIEVFVRDVAPTTLRAYEAGLEIIPQAGSTGSLPLADTTEPGPNTAIFIGSPNKDDGSGRDDWVFAGAGTAFGAVNVPDLRIASALFSGGVSVTEAKYCGTYIFRASSGASGDFRIEFVDLLTNLFDENSQSIPHTQTGITISVAQQVPNDNCANAIPVNDGVTPVTTINATTDGPVLPAACDEKGLQFENDVWFDHTATCSGVLTVSTCGAADFDTRLAVYGTGGATCVCPTDNTNLLACNDDRSGCSGNTSEAFLSVVQGGCYKVRLGGFGNVSGTGDLTVTCGPDLCAEAKPVAIPSSTFGSTKNTLVNDAIGPNCGLGLVNSPGVWYRVTGTGNRLTASLRSTATFDTRLTVYQGTCGSLACVDDANVSGPGGERIDWCATAGTEYLILVHGSGGASGNFTLDVSQTRCDDNNACTTDTCSNDVCVNDPNFDTGRFCCTPSTGELTPIDDDNPCTDDSCNASTGQVTHTPVADGPNAACEDGFKCTLDECQSGECRHIDINTISCVSSAGCPADFDCVDGFCECVGVTVELKTEPGTAPVAGCFGVGEDITLRVILGPEESEVLTDDNVVAAQFFLQYDTSTLQFLSIVPGNAVDKDSPFDFVLLETVNTVAGTIDYQVGTLSGGTRSPATLAVIQFRALAECSGSVVFRPSGPNDAENFVALEGGVQVLPDLKDLSSIPINATPPLLGACPSDVTVAPDPGLTTAVVSWTNPSATDNCDPGAVPVTCDPPSGSVFPAGTTTVTCRAVDSCGLEDQCSFDVTVETLLLTADLELSPAVSASAIERCITFDVWNCDGPAETQQVTIRQPVTFVNGVALDVEAPLPGGQWDCVMVRDEKHTLSSTALLFTADGVRFTTSLAGSHTSGGNWLLGGNLNDDRFIDILDFAIFLPKFLSPAAPNTPCGTSGFDANINGDTLVDLLDLVFISGNALSVSQPPCCPSGAVASLEEGPVMSITVEELIARGLEEAVAADINADGIVDVEDLAAFLRGEYPTDRDDRRLRPQGVKPIRSLRSPRGR